MFTSKDALEDDPSGMETGLAEGFEQLDELLAAKR
ncbi:hypothetical protein BJ991_003259 [Microbacterium immunditiarum]|uniref:Uncharacterized protein n=1 Tax=Microbacterium immunditiarum TaxID=337480 RepID=A0A7Y9KL10_9MICO|nr:hypothetical protein [Microbacterium immunditiarum]